MKAILKIAAAAAGAMMVAGIFAQPAAAGDWGKKYRSHSHHKSHWHSRHRRFFHRKLVRPQYRHRRPVVRYMYVPPPRVTIVRPYAPPRTVSVIPPVPQIASATCREYTTIVTIDGRAVPAYGRACLQPDGSWQLIPIE